MKHYYLAFAAFLLAFTASAQCPIGQSQVVLTITTDNYPGETTWNIADDDGTVLASGGPFNQDYWTYEQTVCVPTNACLTLRIIDSFGDGIYAPGGYTLTIDGVEVSAGAVAAYGLTRHFNCPPGTNCTDAFTIENEGDYIAEYDNTWYMYNCSVTGTYNISTCGTNTCDTRIYVYQNCNYEYLDEGPPGTYAYNDDAGCGAQANLNVIFEAGQSYYIRIGDAADNCPNAIPFSFTYTGAVTGCTDPTACNYNPLAEDDDESCIYPPNPLCTGPDLRFDSIDFVNSLTLMTRTTQSCDIEEGCVLGYGLRYVLAFSSKIDNVGDQDYYIGNPAANPQMFNTQNCHNHTHYNAYGDYRLVDMQGNIIPAGHKNGFCVMDLCGGGQYTCGNMGISSGCYDVYGVGTSCQWVDITEIPTGDYRLIIIVNPFHLPDALGRYETNHENNATGVCIHIEHNEGGAPTWELIDGCEVYTDCMGVVGGSASMDCNGECNGPAMWGDVYDDDALDHQDTEMYLNMIAQMGSEATTCNDLSGNGELSVYDIALMQWCGHSAPIMGPDGVLHQVCAFPRDVVNPQQMAGVAIHSINYEDNYIDIELSSPDANVLGYQFGISGIEISGVESLVDETAYPVMMNYNEITNEIVCISPQDSVIYRDEEPIQLVRVYYDNITASQICIDPMVDIVNKNGERTVSYIYGNCVSSVGVTTLAGEVDAHMVVVPNPVMNTAQIRFVGAHSAQGTLIVRDQLGREVRRTAVNTAPDRTMQVDFSDLTKGVYTISLYQTQRTAQTVRFVKL